MIRRSGILVLLALIACGGAGPPRGPLGETAAKLADIRSATIHIGFTAEGPDGPVGFVLDGPIEMRAGSLPIADLAYTRIDGERRTKARFMSDGSEARLEVGGRTVPVPAEQLGPLGGREGRASMRADRWLRDPKVSDGPAVDGTQTDRVVASLDPVTVVEDLGGLARAFTGAGGEKLGDRDADIIRRAVRSSRFELLTGARDRFLRTLEIEMEFVPPGVDALARALGEVSGVTVRFEVSLENVNEPVAASS